MDGTLVPVDNRVTRMATHREPCVAPHRGGTPLVDGPIRAGATVLTIDGASRHVRGYFRAGESFFLIDYADSGGRFVRYDVARDADSDARGRLEVCLSKPTECWIPNNAMVCVGDDARCDCAMIVWIAYYHDWSGFGLFETELDALRHAVANSMQVKSVTLPAVDVRADTKCAA